MLTFPYAGDRELVGDIRRFGADVEVEGPAGLRSKLQKLFLAAARYALPNPNANGKLAASDKTGNAP